MSLFRGGGYNSETQSLPSSSLPKSGVPQSRPLNKELGGRAGRVPAGRTATPKPGRKKEMPLWLERFHPSPGPGPTHTDAPRGTLEARSSLEAVLAIIGSRVQFG